jgi:uncharacterized cofD-like protein
MKIVGIGGGTGLPVLLSGLKQLNDSGQGPIDITAIVTVADSGGSTGALRQAFGMPAMGDIRNCLVALAGANPVLTSVCQHRFQNPEGFAGHSVGNLILSALYQMSGDFAFAVRQASELLRLKGHVLPSTETPVTLCALYDDGTTAEGEASIPNRDMKISRVWLRPDDPAAGADVIESLLAADAIMLGPGSLYTSIIPNLLVAGVADAIHESRALKIYISNLMTEPGETDGYSAADHIRALEFYLPPRSIDVCVLNSSAIGTAVANRYHEQGSEIVAATPETEDEIRRMGVIPVAAPLLKDGEAKARHDPAILARLIVSLGRGFAGANEMSGMGARSQ